MKHFMMLCMTIGLAAAVACQSDFNNNARLDIIVADTAYIEHRTAIFINAAHITQGLYDLPAIGEVIKSDQWDSMCDYPDSVMEDIRGGLLYRDCGCYIRKTMERLAERFPEFGMLSEEDKKYINDKFNEGIGAVQHQELMNIFKRRVND